MLFNRNNDSPLHIQLKTIIEEWITTGHYKEQIPSERELMDQYKVSRSTVREAVSLLVHKGLLTKVHGKGTFITTPSVHEHKGITSFTENIQQMDIRLLDDRMIPAPSHLSTIEGYRKTYLIKRLRLKKGISIAIEKHYYSEHYYELFSPYNLNSVILYDVLERDLHIRFGQIEQRISATLPSPDDANQLNIPRTACLLRTERRIFHPDGKLIEYYEGLFRADMYSLQMTMSLHALRNSRLDV